MEDTWKIKIPLPYSKLPLYTNDLINYMEDGRKKMKRNMKKIRERARASTSAMRRLIRTHFHEIGKE